jgi:hypothetical protein
MKLRGKTLFQHESSLTAGGFGESLGISASARPRPQEGCALLLRKVQIGRP